MTMLAHPSPSETYRRIDFDARVAGADPGQLVVMCLEQLTSALGSALFADECGDNRKKSGSLTRALSALTALELGVDRDQPIAAALLQLYAAARKAVLDSVVTFDRSTIARVRADFQEVGRELARHDSATPTMGRMLNNGG